ncbi:MAG: hypothetical protein AAGJ18_12445 [Bacteroidota bacterium]
MKVSFNQMLEEQAIVRFYEVLSDTDYDLLVDDLKQYRLKLGLNDWLFYQLIQQSLAKINPHQSRREKVLTTWFLLSKLDYDTRLAFLKKEAFIYVRSMDEVFETPLIEEEGHTFVGLTEMQYQRTSTNKGVYLLNFLGAPNGQPFSFALQALPNLKKNLELKKLRFDWLGESHEVSVRCDKTIVDMMKKYPVIAESDYIKAPFSNTLKASLVPQIQQIVEGKSIVETLKILTTFTRSAFRYKEDEDYFGRSKPMIREEVFFYPYSDCEDRSALFYGLVEEILGLPMIIVAFPDHLTVAVALDQPIGPSIRYKGKKFYICDPTGPSNSIEIGRVPKGYEKQSFEILMDNL